MSVKLPRIIWSGKIGKEDIRVIQLLCFLTPSPDSDFKLRPRFAAEIKATNKVDSMGVSCPYWRETSLDIAGHLAMIYLRELCQRGDEN